LPLEADDTAWAERVRSIRVEVEIEYAGGPERCEAAG
jgi:hypothetical protein